ncbi:MAG: electron transport complex subunit E [Oscillospiraceae bacterium]|nr:electron transport complex subunit E [Oscillospiraceae bacterium]
MAKNNKLKLVTKGLLKENPVLRLVLGTCPTLAVTTLAINGIGMGAAATFVLICSNVVISALRKIIPDKVRIPAFITVIAGFVTIVQMFVKAFAPDLDKALGVFLPLIVVNCIILGRAEAFASKNNVIDSALDGLGMGLGFTLTLTVMGCIREFFGAGALFGIQILDFAPLAILGRSPGGFFVFGALMALAVKLDMANPSTLGNGSGCVGGCLGCTYACAPEKKAEAVEGGKA